MKTNHLSMARVTTVVLLSISLTRYNDLFPRNIVDISMAVIRKAMPIKKVTILGHSELRRRMMVRGLFLVFDTPLRRLGQWRRASPCRGASRVRNLLIHDPCADVKMTVPDAGPR